MALIGEDLGVYYKKDDWIFKNVNLKVSPGEVLGLSGYSGCGKTTLARVLAGYIQPQNGKVTVDCEPFEKKEFRPVQLIYQHPEKAINPRWKMDKVLTETYTPSQDILDAFGIKNNWKTRWPIELSGGELQRFCIVRALNPNTRYIIADEMTTMLDAITQAWIWHIFLDICKRREIGIIVVSHEKPLLNRLCDNVVEVGNMWG